MLAILTLWLDDHFPDNGTVEAFLVHDPESNGVHACDVRVYPAILDASFVKLVLHKVVRARSDQGGEVPILRIYGCCACNNQ